MKSATEMRKREYINPYTSLSTTATEQAAIRLLAIRCNSRRRGNVGKYACINDANAETMEIMLASAMQMRQRRKSRLHQRCKCGNSGKHACINDANVKTMEITLASTMQMRKWRKLCLHQRCKCENDGNHACINDANAKTTEITLASTMQMQKRRKSRLHQRCKPIYNNKQILIH